MWWGSWTVYLAVYDGTTLSDLSSARFTVTKPADAANTPPVADFLGTPRVNFFTPAFTNEVELATTVFYSGNSWGYRRHVHIRHRQAPLPLDQYACGFYPK